MTKERDSLSATRLGKEYNLTGQEMNHLLKKEGFLSGEPGNYIPTEKGEKYIHEESRDNGYGGYCARSWGWTEWDPAIKEQLNVDSSTKAAIHTELIENRRIRAEKKEQNSEEMQANISEDSQAVQPYDFQDSQNFWSMIGTVGVGLLIIALPEIITYSKKLFVTKLQPWITEKQKSHKREYQIDTAKQAND